MFDPIVGRWLSPDPMRQYASPYLAMGNNPVNRVDPDGGSDGPIKVEGGPCRCSTYDADGNIVTYNAQDLGTTNISFTNYITQFGPNGEGGGSTWASATLAFITADVLLPEPSDAAWPKWAGYAVAGTIAGTIVYLEDISNPFPGPWKTTTVEPLDYIPTPHQGFDPEKPSGFSGRITRWAFAGYLGYKLYKNLDKTIPEYTPPADNTRYVVPVPIIKPGN